MEKKISALRNRKRMLKKAAELLEQYYAGKLKESALRKQLRACRYLEKVEAPLPRPEDVAALRVEARELTAPINAEKDALCELLNQFSGVREFRKEFLSARNVISIFDSYLTRTLGIEQNALTMDLLVVKTCYFKVLQDIIENGFLLNGEKYIIYTASAGQIRTKRSVFIREARLQECADRLTCGLTVERINELGGVNVNKYLAYMALTNSATDEWAEFNIDKCIVVEDMETDVTGVVDYIDSETYEIMRQKMAVPMTQTDGCGMVLPRVSKKNFMLRAPWIKGLLAVFPFDKFIREADRAEPGVNHGLVRDIYGVEHDVLAEDIEVIFCRSQFKMAKYYSSWDQYRDFFKKFDCRAGICNMEPDTFDKAKINYQMLQTLTDLTDDELRALSSKTADKLGRLSTDRNTMLQVFGATPGKARKNAFQEALSIYPELLQDEYCRDTLRLIKAKIEKEAKAGRLDIDGMYTFIIPDLYSFCQWLFLGCQNPKGLLEDGEVYCRLFEPGQELDCLRSPHLFLEHVPRRNMYGANEGARRWFLTNALYISTKDLLSRIIQCDFDGDKALVVADRVLVEAAKRNTKDIVPLYYLGLKGPPQELCPKNIYKSMTWAYTSCNIGIISNQISRIWCSDLGVDLELVKWLTFRNNLVIDASKNLYLPPCPDFVNERTKKYTKEKVPYFFIEAKGKTEAQVSPINNSSVNRIRTILPNIKLNFDKQSLGKFDWRMLVSSDKIPNNEITQRIVDTYRRRTAHLSFKFDDESDHTNRAWICQQIREDILGLHPDSNFVVDVLVKHLFYKVKSRRKQVFWECFGNEVVENLKRNVDQSAKMCVVCGKRFYQEGRHQTMCRECSAKRRRSLEADRKRRARKASAF